MTTPLTTIKYLKRRNHTKVADDKKSSVNKGKKSAKLDEFYCLQKSHQERIKGNSKGWETKVRGTRETWWL